MVIKSASSGISAHRARGRPADGDPQMAPLAYCRAVLKAASISSVFQQARAFFIVFRPSGVTPVIRRVVRCRRETPKMRLQLLNGFAEVALGIFSESAGAGKAAGFDNAGEGFRAENRSIIRFIPGYWRSLSTEGRGFSD